MRVLAITRLPWVDPSSRHRVIQFKDLLKDKHGIEINFSSFYDDQSFSMYKINKLPYTKLFGLFFRQVHNLLNTDNYDVLWLLRSISPIEVPLLVKIAQKKGVKVVYEFDDAIYLNHGSKSFKRILARGWKSVPKYTTLADAIIVGNDNLASWVKKFNHNVKVIPTGINVKGYRVKGEYETNEKINIGWIGSPATSPHLELILPVLQSLAKELPIRLILIGAGNIKVDDFECKLIPWSEASQKEWLHKFDIGIGPLKDNEFTRGKCGFKLIQYMASGVPVLASPVGIQTSIIEDGINGYLCDDLDVWRNKIIKLAKDPALRKRLGLNGREKALEFYDVSVLADSIANVFKSLRK